MPLFRFKRWFGDKLLLFIHIPKTGGASVERMLRAAGGHQALWAKERALGVCSFQHMHAEMLAACIPEGFCDLTFTVCRNPYDRLFSEYKMREVTKGSPVTFEDWFDSAISEYASDPFYADNHIRPQHEFITEACQIFKLEDGLERAVATATRQLGIRPSRRKPHFNRVDHSPVSLRKATQQKILSLYGKDFGVFGYDTDDFGRSFQIAE